jgi:pathogenesis-related protein 1
VPVVFVEALKRPLWLIALAASAWPQSPHGVAAPPPWADEIIKAHNSIRSRLNLPPLVWSDKIAAVAQQWAETLSERNQFIHRPKSIYGENLFEIDGARSSPTQVVSQWASEARDYDYASNRCNRVCGHYTQIVWRGTRELGCGVALGPRREIWVCDYSPPGNVIGRRPF